MTGLAAPAAQVAQVSEKVRSTYAFISATVAGYLAGIAILSFLFWSTAPISLLGAWWATFAVMLAARVAVARAFFRAKPKSERAWLHWQRLSNVGTVAAGALWGTSAWIFYSRASTIQQVGLITVIYTFCVAAIPVLALQPRLYMAYAALCFFPLATRIASDGSAYGLQLAGILMLIIVTSAALSRTYRQALQGVIDLKLRADGLAAQLQAEKGVAEAARREAEIANRAKTQFFTAASHDLRQPLHAMGLFAEALREKTQDREAAQLVNSINESVDALEGLFSELLDITRIDSGGVDVNPQSFEVGDILRKLRLHFEPAAFEKGLSLRLRGARHWGVADPLLVERILRNLVSNAIRYTEDGTVLVSCRARGGQLALQVWDTGPGISGEEQQKIFDEFYQVSETPRAAHEQRRGLGLGLAIVKRLAGLMDMPLALRSEVGHGSVFTLTLPVGRPIPRAPKVLAGKAPNRITLAGRLIVVVEDEPAVRSGLEVLMTGWGATLASFDSVVECLAWVDAADASQLAPDLVIADYRLENGLIGPQAIEAVRRRFGRQVPAIVVTGSTMTAHEKEAQEGDFHLLIKPVLPNKLRAMIAFKLVDVRPSIDGYIDRSPEGTAGRLGSSPALGPPRFD